MWIIVHQNALGLSLAALATRTSLVPMISMHPGFLILLGLGNLHRISIYKYCSSYSSEQT